MALSKQLLFGVIGTVALLQGNLAAAKVYVSPFVSMSSTKSIKPGANATEKAKNKQKETYGIRAGLSFWKLLKVEGSVGQSKLTTTEKTSQAVDEFGEINYKEDLNVNTDDPDLEMKVTEVMNKARAGIVFDPGFWIFIARAKAGVQATQRIVTVQETGKDAVEEKPPITYKPYAGVGAGVKLGRFAHFIAEYNFFFFKFPETEPFEREVAVSVSVSI